MLPIFKLTGELERLIARGQELDSPVYLIIIELAQLVLGKLHIPKMTPEEENGKPFII